MIRRIAWPAVGVAAMALLRLNWRDVGDLAGVSAGSAWSEGVRVAAGIGFWAAIAVALIRLLDAGLWRRLLRSEARVVAPKLLHDLVGVLVWVAAVMIVVADVFHQSVAGLLTTSGVAVAIIGFALRGMISDLFSGIAMGLERAFRLGDWIEVGTVIGQVEEMTWRATTLITHDNICVVIPNGKLADTTFRNFNRPGPVFRDSIDITVDASVAPGRVESLLLAAAGAVPDTATAPRPPVAEIRGYGDAGILWSLHYWLSDVSRRNILRDQINRRIVENLHYAGVSLPAPRMELARLPPAPRDLGLMPFLRRIDLLDSLTDSEITALAAEVSLRRVDAAIPVVRRGDVGQSLFMIKEGLLSVSVCAADGVDRPVASLGAGKFFGEMSLLTGAPRSATVTPLVASLVVEITKDVIEPLMRQRPEIARIMSEFLAERQIHTMCMVETAVPHADREAERRTLASQMLARICGFFGLQAEVASLRV